MYPFQEFRYLCGVGVFLVFSIEMKAIVSSVYLKCALFKKSKVFVCVFVNLGILGFEIEIPFILNNHSIRVEDNIYLLILSSFQYSVFSIS